MEELDKMSYSGYHGFFNLSKTCRACLSVQEQIQNIPEDVYSYCTSVKVTLTDGLPLVICQACFELLNRLYYFKQQCVRSDILLKQQLKPLPLQPQFVKQEEEKGYDVKNEFCILESRNLSKIAHKDENSKSSNDLTCASIDNIATEEHTKDSEHEEHSIDLEKLEDNRVADELKSLEMLKKKYKKSNKRATTMLYCQKCDKSFYKYVKLEAHMRKHFGMKPDSTISCNQCDKKFTTEKNLKSHLRVHTGERKYKCKTCGKAFAYLNVLKNHERAHAGIKKYVCHQCGKKFVQLTNLNTHLLQHSGEKPYVCDPCNRRFGQPSEYKLHMLRHTGVKNFACNLCTLRFYTNANLQKHMGVHSDDRPYACKLCDKRFKTRSYMAVHNRTHTGERPFSCDYCSMKFMSGKDRRNHHKTHTGEKAPPRPRKLKQNNQVQNNSHPIVSQQLQTINPQNINVDMSMNDQSNNMENTSVNAFVSQQTLHESTTAKILSKTICPYGNMQLKPMDKHTSNTFLLPPVSKSQCSYITPMY